MIRFLPVLAAAAFLAAACGGSGTSKADYAKSLNQAEAALQKSVSGLGSLSGGASPGAVAQQLDAGGDAMDQAATNFNKITPPDDAKHAHGEIVDGLHRFADTFHAAADAARKHDTKSMLSALQNIDSSPGAVELQKAQNELSAHGYKIANG